MIMMINILFDVVNMADYDLCSVLRVKEWLCYEYGIGVVVVSAWWHRGLKGGGWY